MNIRIAVDQRGEAPEQKGQKPVDWTPILADQAANPYTSLTQIAARHGVSTKALSAQVKKQAAVEVDRAQIIGRLFRLVEWQVVDLQKEMNVMQVENRRSGEKEVVLLGKIAANLEKLMALDGGESTLARKGKRTKAIVDLRSKLVERIEHLKRQ